MEDRQLKEKAIKFKGSDYVQVKDRVNYLVDNYEWRYEIDQDYQFFEDSKTRVVKTTLTIWDNEHKNSCIYVWLAQEVEWTSFINATSALENCATSSLWRSIACLWIWVIDSFASINEIEKAENRAKSIDITKEWPFTDLPWFNKEQLEELKGNIERVKEHQTSDSLIKAISTKYRVSKAMKQEIADFWATL